MSSNEQSSKRHGAPDAHNLAAPPIHIAPIAGENPISWLRRLALRYQISPRNILREAGSRREITSTPAAINRILARKPNITTNLGLSTSERGMLRGHTLLGAALTAYTRLYHHATIGPGTTSHYCPACLAETSTYWRKDWTNPLLAVCPDHGTLLLEVCPACGGIPHQSPIWLGHPLELWQCTARTTDNASTTRNTRPWCGYDLRTATTEQATSAQTRAQHRLLDLAANPDMSIDVCGIAITGRIGFDAMVELLTTFPERGRNSRKTSPRPANVAAELAETLNILDQASPAQAGHQLSLRTTVAHAPRTAATAGTAPVTNPLLGALTLDYHRATMSPTSQLSFHAGARHGRYPVHPAHPANARRHLMLPEHHPERPLPTAAWICQSLWPGSIGALDNRPTSRAEAALLLACLGSTVPLPMLLVDLGLPANFTHSLDARIRTQQDTGTWPELLTQLDDLLEHLRASPPWNNYRNRRILADDLTVLECALIAANPRQDTPTPDTRRRFWELFTGGDALFAPHPITVTSRDHDQWAHRRTELDREHTDDFIAAFQILDRSSPLKLGEPLTWQPPSSTAAFTYQPAPAHGPTINIDAEPFVIAHAVLTLDCHITRDRDLTDAAHHAMTGRADQPGTLDTETAKHYANPVAAIYTQLSTGKPIKNADGLPAQPFLRRYQRCLPEPLNDPRNKNDRQSHKSRIMTT